MISEKARLFKGRLPGGSPEGEGFWSVRVRLRCILLWRFGCLVGFVWLSGCCPSRYTKPEKVQVPQQAPHQVHFRSRTQTFNKTHAFVLHEGRIWYQLRTAQGPLGWKLLGKTGLPEGCGIKGPILPTRLVAISADGIHLQALSREGTFYRTTTLYLRDLAQPPWTDTWGWPAALGPSLRLEIGDPQRWDVSDSHPFHLKTYEDGNHKQHRIGFGVAHLYLLGPKGRRIFYNDWWLPSDWSRQLCGPEHGQFQAVNLSVSGSTIFLINARGEMYTRMHDFDVSGENPLLTYTFVDKNPPRHVRKIPMPAWRKQPAVEEGQITSNITIFQTGTGNSARELRVEGQRQGVKGFFYKNIFAAKWLFQKTDLPLTRPFFQPPTSRPAATQPTTLKKRSISFIGTLRRAGAPTPLSIEISDFDMICSPASLKILYEGKPLLHQGKPLEFPFHHVHTLVTKQRPIGFWKKGIPADIRAAIEITDDYKSVKDPKIRALLDAYFKDVRVINFTGQADISSMKLQELTQWDLFRAHEKPWGVRFRLQMTKRP